MDRLPSLVNNTRLEIISGIAATLPLGCFVEVGVYKGGSAWYWNRISQLQNRALHLFDTFIGIPEKSPIDSHRVNDFSDTNAEEVKAALPDAIFHIGIFPDTLTDDIDNIAFVHVDCDQYATTKAVIDLLYPRMVKGGIMIFDDWGLDGARKAIEESGYPIHETLFTIPCIHFKKV